MRVKVCGIKTEQELETFKRDAGLTDLKSDAQLALSENSEYEKKRADSIREQGSFDLTKWYGLYFDVENGQITQIDFGDLAAIQQGH